MFLMWEGIWFQIFGPQTEKTRFLNWIRVLISAALLKITEIVGKNLTHVEHTIKKP